MPPRWVSHTIAVSAPTIAGQRSSRPPSWSISRLETERRPRAEFAIVAGLTALGLLLRVWRIDALPPGDDGVLRIFRSGDKGEINHYISHVVELEQALAFAAGQIRVLPGTGAEHEPVDTSIDIGVD